MRTAREALGLSRPEFATKCGYTVRTLENNEKGSNEPGACLIAAFLSLGINANWLLTGEGEMLLKDMAPKPAPAPEPVKINIKALAASIQAMHKLAKPGESEEALASKAARFYQYMLDEALITPEGLGPGLNKDAAA